MFYCINDHYVVTTTGSCLYAQGHQSEYLAQNVNDSQLND